MTRCCKPRFGLSVGLGALLAAVVVAGSARAGEPDLPNAQRDAASEPPDAQRDTMSSDVDESGYSLAPLTDQSGPGWSPRVPGVPEGKPIAPRSFGAGIGGSPGTIELGPLPGLGDWSPSMGIGPGLYDNITRGP